MAKSNWLYRREIELVDRWISDANPSKFSGPGVYKRVIAYLKKLKAFYEEVDKMYDEKSEWYDSDEHGVDQYYHNWTNEELRKMKGRFDRVESSLKEWIEWANNTHHLDLAHLFNYLLEFSGSFNFEVNDKDESAVDKIVAPVARYMDLVEGVKKTGLAAVPEIENYISAVESLESSIKSLVDGYIEKLWNEGETSTNAANALKYMLKTFKKGIEQCYIRREGVDDLRKLISSYNYMRDRENVHVTLENDVVDREYGYVPSAFHNLMWDLRYYDTMGRDGIGELLMRIIGYAGDFLNTFEGELSNYIDRQNSGRGGSKLNMVDDFALLDELSNARNALNAVSGKIGKFASECDAAGKEGFKVVENFWKNL